MSALYEYPVASCRTLSAVVTDEGGRMVDVHPTTHIVWPMLDCVTEGLSSPGVLAKLGNTMPDATTESPPLSATGAVVGSVNKGSLSLMVLRHVRPASRRIVSRAMHENPAARQLLAYLET